MNEEGIGIKRKYLWKTSPEIVVVEVEPEVRNWKLQKDLKWEVRKERKQG